jgi:hypothetical protein
MIELRVKKMIKNKLIGIKNWYYILMLMMLMQHSLSYAQFMSEIKIPEPLTSTYEKLKSSYFIKNTKHFSLSGQVKTIKEIRTNKSGIEGGLVANDTCIYEFLPNGKLLLFKQNDTIDKLENSNAKIEKYVFDSLGEKLLEAAYYDGTIQQNCNKVTQKFNKNGNIILETYQRFYDDKYHPHEKYMWDYILRYNWSKNFDTVSLIYNYKTEKTSYQRHYNRQYTFNNNKLTSSEAVHHTNITPIGRFFNEEVRSYDSLGNLVKIIYYDRAIKNSFNIDSMFEYFYNAKNELTKVLVYSLIHNGIETKDFNLDSTIKIDYLEYDELGNWIEKKVSYLHNDRKMSDGDAYTRTINYYD